MSGAGQGDRPWRQLTAQEKQAAVLPLADAGLSYAQMAERLSVRHGPMRFTQTAAACRAAGIVAARRAAALALVGGEAGEAGAVAGERPEAAWGGLRPADKAAALRPLVEAGLSASQIAAALAPRYGVLSRESVIAACRRAGLALQQPQGSTSRAAAARRGAVAAGDGAKTRLVSGDAANRQRPDPASLPTLSALLARMGGHSASHAERAGMTADERRALALTSCRPAGPVGLHALNAQTCRWPLTADDGSTVYCGESRTHGAFCKGHGALAYCPAPADKARRKKGSAKG
ncbi:GcrA family cell cycle regulator [Pannonibacter sp. SL95]|uniref:GcrA family cell cycle regulator n=2 Tax=Pannonibacter sp. SL95 TaxID=2995153 RepID=UPI0022768413|nr:GcrA family cell cycle regulator [Pannonibacter sp. SL95]MCY1704505.1 hypothetical protein [Pannonibacter sp. SL95]